MEIHTIKQNGAGYLVTNSSGFHCIPNDPNNGDYMAVQRYIAEGGIVDPEFTDEELLQNAKDKKKAEINALRDLNKSKNIQYAIGGISYFFQRDIMSNMAFINNIASANDIAISGWVTAENLIVNITKYDLTEICALISERDSHESVQGRLRKDALKTLNTVEEVEDFDIKQILDILS